jgi:hypothetical protein
MTISDTIDEVDRDDVSLVDGFLGYNILVRGERAGSIEGYPGYMEYIELELYWEGKGVARAALNELIALSREDGHSKLTTTNTTNPAMKHIRPW